MQLDYRTESGLQSSILLHPMSPSKSDVADTNLCSPVTTRTHVEPASDKYSPGRNPCLLCMRQFGTYKPGAIKEHRVPQSV